MPLTRDRQPVQRLTTCGTDPALADGIRSRRPAGRDHHPDTLRTKDPVEAGHELAVPIVDQELRPEVALAELPAQVALRDASSMKNSTYSCFNQTVSAVKESLARTAPA
jgi:hypothetical protein